MTKNPPQSNPRPSDQEVRDQAVNPNLSCIVQAPAGSGKTTLLVERYLNLLGIVNRPEEILAITFTKKAAREMRQRVLTKLSEDTPLARAVLERDNKLNWQIQLNPQRLKIQTIDSFLNGLVQKMPYLSQMNLEFSPTDTSSSLYEEAATAVLRNIVGPRNNLSEAVGRALGYLDNRFGSAVSAIANMLETREHWIPLLANLSSTSSNSKNAEAIEELQNTREEFVQTRIKALSTRLHKATGEDLDGLCNYAAKNLSRSFQDIENPEDLGFLKDLLLTSKGESRKQVNKNNGFPADAKDKSGRELQAEMKAQMHTALEEIRGQVQPEFISSVTSLGETVFDDSAASVTNDYALVLVLAVEELTRIFEESQQVDFSAISIAAQRALDETDGPTELALSLDYKISHLLVDEFQDTSEGQLRMLNSLMAGWQPNDGNTFFAVGDPTQSIYTFRQANFENFLNVFDNGMDAIPLEPLRLTQNFRSSPTLVNWVNAQFPKIFIDPVDSLLGSVNFQASTAYNDFEGYVHFTVFQHPKGISNSDRLMHEATALADDVQELLERIDEKETVALLVKTRTHLHKYLAELRDRGISCRGIKVQKMAEYEEVQDLKVLVEILKQPSSIVSWYALLLSPLVGLELTEIEEFHKFRPEDSVLTRLRTYAWEDTSQLIVTRLVEAIESAFEDSHRPFCSVLQRVWYQLGGPSAYSGNQVIVNANRLFAFVEENLNAPTDISVIDEWLEEEYVSEVNPDAKVEVLTIHAAKGLEWDYVFLPHLTATEQSNTEPLILVSKFKDKYLFSYKRYDEPDPLHAALTADQSSKLKNERRRLLYVAVTRAKRGLFLYASTTKGIDEIRVKNAQDSSSEGHRQDNLTFFELLVQAGAEVEVKTVDSEDLDQDEEAKSEVLWSRLPVDFRFDPDSITAKLLPKYDQTILNQSVYDPTVLDEDTDPLDNIGPNVNIEIGNLLHEELHRMVRLGNAAMPSKAVTTRWRNNLTLKGLDGREINEVIDTVTVQLNNVLSDSDGQWLLSTNHEDSQSEVSLQLHTEQDVAMRRVDRSFIDEQGVRWIIDYKSSATTEDKNAEIENLVSQYSMQLEGYAKIYQELEDRPIQTALYIASMPELVKVAQYP